MRFLEILPSTFYLLIALTCCLFISCHSSQVVTEKGNQENIAFPGAEGFGKYTTGGRGGQVLIVENLLDSGPGSFRAAIEQAFPRIIVFNVSGTIALKSLLEIKHGNVTIAGQSAPGDGICLKNYNLEILCDNVIIRYIRSRLGDQCKQEDDCLSVKRQKNIIIDHCSFTWATDEVLSAYDNENFTLQYCIIAESLDASVHEKGDHGYGGIWGGNGASFHHNLLAHHTSRLPRFCGARYHKDMNKELVDFRNNVIYNWQHNNSYGGEGGRHNVVNNYYKPGPTTYDSKKARILNAYSPYGLFYVSGNTLSGNEKISADNHLGVISEDLDSCLTLQPFKVVEIPEESPEQAFNAVLTHAGASFKRDEVDQRIISEVRNGSAYYGKKGDGIIDSQDQVGGWPMLKQYDERRDSDKDGMPDKWELAHSLDPNDHKDSSYKSLHKHYTNIEVFLNSLVE
jgi:hypothetical protein